MKRLSRLLLTVALLAGCAVAAVTDSAAQGCDVVPTGVRTEDYFLPFKLPAGLMPDPQFDNWRAKIEVHRVTPDYANGKCSSVPARAAVLVHGRSVAAAPTFDLRNPATNGGGEISVQEGLARSGIDTFAPSLLGYGRSGLEVMGDRILYYSVPRNLTLIGSIGVDNGLRDATTSTNVADDWTQVTALSGGRILYYSPARGLVLIGQIDADNALRDITTHYGWQADWSQITALSRDRILFYNRPGGRGHVVPIKPDNTFDTPTVYEEGTFADDWTQITGLSGDRVLYYSSARGLVLIGAIDERNDLRDVKENYGYENDWTHVTALSGNRVLFYSAHSGRGRIEYIDPSNNLHRLKDIGAGALAPDWTDIASYWDEGLNDAGNASLPFSDCPSQGCDATHNPVFPADQQGDPMNGLWNNPLRGQYRSHSSDRRFARTDVWVRDIRQVIQDAVARGQPSNGKVDLVGFSFGGPRAARTLLSTNPILPISQPDTAARVNTLTLIAPFPFGDPPNPVQDAPPPGKQFVSFPLALTRDTFALGVPDGCASDTSGGGDGLHVPGTEAQFRTQQRDLESVGLNWGGLDPANPTGLIRIPTFSANGFNQHDLSQLTTPTLVIGGRNDTFMLQKTPPVHAQVFDALPTSMTNKALVDIDCATHNLLIEVCDGTRCTPPTGQTPYGGGSTWKGPHSTITAGLIEWMTRGTFNNSGSGRFAVDKSGVACVMGTTGGCGP